MNNWPSTTQVLKDFGLYGDIARWSDKAAQNRDESDACTNPAQRGRVVDGVCNLLLMRKGIPAEWRAKHETCCVPFVEGYEKLLHDHDVKLVNCGYEVINKAERYVGHPDQRVLFDGKPTLIDLKSGGVPGPTDLQLWSYLRAERSMDPKNKDLYQTQLIAIQLTRGDYKPHFFTDPRVGDSFILYVRVWWDLKSRLKEIEA